VKFTPEQERAIDVSMLGRDACIVAGPGSGKTTVLVERYRRLLEAGIKPAEILAITFTEKAAANMRERLMRQFHSDEKMLRELDRAYVSTIHGFCNRILHENAAEAGLDPEFTILDEQMGELELRRAIRETLDAFVLTEPDVMRRLLDVTEEIDLEYAVPDVYEAMRCGGAMPEELNRWRGPQIPSLETIVRYSRNYIEGFPSLPNESQRTARDNAREWLERLLNARNERELYRALCQKGFNNQQRKNRAYDERHERDKAIETLRGAVLDQMFTCERDLVIRIIAAFDQRYRARKDLLAALDFNDLEAYTTRLLEEHPEIRRQLNEQFRQVMIDEFQDTSAQQGKLISLVRGPDRFYAVGDLNQSIYGFRHASPEVFERYREHVHQGGGHVVELIENWRSRNEILLATQTIVQGAPGIVPRDLEPALPFPPLSEPAAEVLIAEPPANEGYTLEARLVLNRIIELRRTLRIGEEQRHARFSDFAIIVRNSGVVPEFAAELERAGIEYNVNRRTGYFESREARDLLALTRMLANPHDEIATLTVLRSPLAAVSEEAIFRLKKDGNNLGAVLNDFDKLALTEEDHLRLMRFTEAFGRWRAALTTVPLDRVLLRALDEMGISWDPRSPDGQRIEKFISIARAHPEMTIAEFLLYVGSLRAADAKEADSPIDEQLDAIEIMTAHAAKGLEFPVVILAALDKGIDTGTPELSFTLQHGLGIKWSNEEIGDQRPLSYQLNKAELKCAGEGEANRLLYVALTRAQQHLILSWTRRPNKKDERWAGFVGRQLGTSGLAAPYSSVHDIQSPGGDIFQLAVRCTNSAEPVSDAVRGAWEHPAAEVLAKPELREQFNPNATATDIATFTACPRRFYLGQRAGWSRDLLRPRAGAASSRATSAADLGTEVHDLLAGVSADAPSIAALHLATTFERSDLGRRAARARHRENEWDFVFALGDLIVSGKIDLWFEDARGLVIVDYKTDDVTAAEASQRAEAYRIQLGIYAIALERALDRKVSELWLHFLTPDTAIQVTPPLREEVARLAADFVRAHEQGDFPIVPTQNCYRCEFHRTICPARVVTSAAL
jgi:ATP-dependent exoDNAse (exonuclease V) beta subunit